MTTDLRHLFMGGMGDGIGNEVRIFALATFAGTVLFLLLTILLFNIVCCLVCKIRRLKRQANLVHEEEDGVKLTEIKNDVEQGDRVIMSEVEKSVGELEDDTYDSVIVSKVKKTPCDVIEDDILPGYDIIGQTDNTNVGKTTSMNLSVSLAGRKKENKVDDYSLVGNKKNEAAYNTLVHCTESLSTSKQSHTTVVRASSILPDEYESIGKSMSSSVQVVGGTDPALGGGSRPSSPPPPLPPPIDEKNLPDELLGAGKDVTCDSSNQAFYCNSVEVKPKLSELEQCDIKEVFMDRSAVHTQEEASSVGKDNQKQKDKENISSGMELYMNVTLSHPPRV